MSEQGSVANCRRTPCSQRGQQKRAFGHAVAGSKRGAAKTATLEGSSKLAQGFGTNRLGAQECDIPTGQIEASTLLLRRLRNTQIKGKVWPSAMGRACGRDGGEPADRSLCKMCRRHYHHLGRRIDWCQKPTDQAHVMVGRKPRHTAGGRTDAKARSSRFQVEHYVAVTDNDPLGIAGRARRILQERNPVRLYDRWYPLF